MPFEVTSDEELIRKTVAEFAEATLKGKPAEHIDRERRFPREALSEMAGLGLFGMLVPPEAGGAGTSTVAYALALEEVARASGVAATLLNGMNATGTFPIAAHASERVKQEILPSLLSGARFSAWALAEPGAGSDLQAVEARAEKKGDAYRITGLKSFVMGGGEADVYVVFARTSRDPAGGVSAFLVDKDQAGVRFTPPERMMTLRGANLTEMFLKDVEVPEDRRLGAEGEGLKIALGAHEVSRLGVAAIAVGLMAESLDDARQYSSDRQQFRLPLKAFQGIQWKIADMDAELRAARLLTLSAAWKRDKGEEFAVEAAAAKLFAAEAAKRVTQESLRIHGGNGFMRDLPLERINRDARAMAIVGGTSEMQRTILAAKLLDL